MGEAAAVARFIERVPNGPVGLVIEGEPGIGKTTVWLEAVRLAREREYRVLQARPAEAEAELSYAALADLVGGVFDQASGDLPTPQRHALEVTLLRQEADERADPRTTASALVGVLSSLAADRPLVIAVDDVQWLDPASARALEFAARRLPARLGIVVARRLDDGEVVPLGLDRALDPEVLERLTLGPLSLAALHQLIEGVVGLTLSRPLLVRIESLSGGNPFFALETARALARDGGLPGPGDPLPVPRSLQNLVSDRVRQLSGPAQAAALAAAALSRPTSMSVAVALSPEVDADAAILEAEEAGVLVRDGDRLRFWHPLLASAIYGSAGTTRRRELHRRLADVVVDPEERARHLARSMTEADSGVADAIEQAAELAERRGAPEAAAELYAAAYRLTPERRQEDLVRRMLGGADSLATAGDLVGARSQATGVLEIAPPGSLRARALYLLGRLASYTETIDVRIGYHERALAEAGGDHALRVKILLALVEGIVADPQRAAQRADEAIELLRGSDDGLSLAQALMNKFVAEAILGHGARNELLEEALALDARSEGRGLPLIWFHWIDDLDATRRRYSLEEELYRDHGDVLGAAEIVEFLSMAEFRAGNWDQAERALEDACATLEQLELRGPLTASFADRSLIDAHRGRIDRARTTLLDIVEPGKPLDVFWRAVCHSALGAVEFCDGRYEAADRAWTAMTEEAQLVEWNDFLEDRSQPDHIETLLALGELPRARRVLEHLEWRGRTLPRMWIDATLPRARALILAAEAKLPEALAILDAAPVVGALPFERARLLLVRGQIERRSNRRLAAKASLSQALSMFEELGSPPWAARARAEAGRLGLRHRPPNELTATEQRIAELAAAGRTNRQIAEAAFVSPKTVEANLARAYRKLGVRSRAELGARISSKPRDSETNS
ncbi:MAG: AAA family ATPase [Chloroflexi bacterium]|nr:AAA family ATPase [Chloroflexota bacterium]